ncbi:ChaN family lipoprotein [Anaeromyxobacter diazotrophicus]|uniref:Haem-binding uptake Tiki superfamily ChaN domain-containing protein n=1 Tax=Anaeromyxobacter diazotrophicus TaxID=2590199 RepID=A0A7I9VFT2_9BACT|nr:ChaN family lipoprotein [Anaeromyxobacter diazotrophicus]GEJ55266.1 hypothetical protein AMYX_00070 [Anaeromyxobacter diazotrophicus]
MTSPASRPSALLALPLLLAACATHPRAAGADGLLHADHPLAGRIWDVRAGAFVDDAALERALVSADFVLLGETHDNPEHHRLQARALAGLVAAGRRPAVAFEMLDVAQQPRVDEALAGPGPHDPGALARAIGWAKSGWPDFALYRPIFEVALRAGLPIEAANLSRKQVHEVVRTGAASLAPEVRTLLDRAGPLSKEATDEIRDEMYESHCREMPRTMLEPFVTMQRARDAQMAERLLAAARGREGGAVLIAGAGHVRDDRAVPSYLAREAPGRTRRAVAFQEVSPALRTPADYAAAFGAGGLPFDYVVFTAAAPREDPCQGLREHQRRPGPGPQAPAPAGVDL